MKDKPSFTHALNAGKKKLNWIFINTPYCLNSSQSLLLSGTRKLKIHSIKQELHAALFSLLFFFFPKYGEELILAKGLELS